MTKPTTDLCDEYEGTIQVCTPVFHDFGGLDTFDGRVVTVATFEDNSRVRELLAEPGEGRVLVVDGGGSLRRALVGGNLAEMGARNGWAGIVVNGCVRDTAELAAARIGIKALAVHPMRTEKLGMGRVNVPVTFAGVTFRPGDHLHADRDGIVTLPPGIAEAP